MLEKKKTFNETKVVTIIGTGTTFTGEVKSQGTIRVEGAINGRIQCEDTIVIHEAGKVKADLIAGQIIVSGQVEGNIFAHERLEVTEKGKIIGDITAPRVSIAEGVIFEGKCTMKPPGEAKPPEQIKGPAAEQVKAAPQSAPAPQPPAN